MLTTIFWPTDVKLSGFCYGWINPAICVAGVLKVDTEQDAEIALEASYRSLQWRLLSPSCGSKPVIIGKCNFLTKSTVKILPVPILELRAPLEYNIIYYYRHNSRTLRFYTLDVLTLDATTQFEDLYGSAYLPSAQHDFTAPSAKHLTSSINATVVNQFNAAKTLEQVLQIRHLESAQEALREDDTLGLASSAFARALAFISGILLIISNVPTVSSFSMPALKDLFATVQQIDVRAEQMEFFSAELGILRRRMSSPIHIHSARYTNFFNTVWLILNDITMGIALGSFLCENHIVLSRILIRTVEGSLIIWVQWVLQWLDSWPAGLKLNTELSRFYSHTFIGIVTVWGEILHQGIPYLSRAIYTIGIFSSGGITVATSLLMDLLAFLTMHIFLCYTVSGAVYQRMLKITGSLWNLFRGKRYNVLRNRTDSWEYDIDQLLFGTILFTLVAFLFPTVLAYYALFAVMRLGVLVMQASLETLLALMNHFPLFALMLRVKDPWRLPGGIYFFVVQEPGPNHGSLVIKNQPVPLSIIFFQFVQLLSQLAKHYNPLRLFWCLFSGQYLAAIPRYSIRYNKIPIS